MSLLTQCPACQTYYRVVPDQLRISDGWVKCGQCSDIFDASAHLLEIDADSNTPDASAQADTTSQAVSQEISTPEENNLTFDLDLPPDTAEDIGSTQADMSAAELDQDEVAHAEMTGSFDLEADAERAEPVWTPQDMEVDASPEVVPQLVFPEDEPVIEPGIPDQPPRVRWDDPLPLSAEAGELVPSAPAEAPVTFLRDDSRASIWQKPVVRAVLMLLATLLTGALAGQWVYHERDKLAASHPDLKPVLQSACGWLNCVVQPVRQIDALTIDSVSFNKLGNDTYKLSFLVKNTSELPLAYPALELVLTDAEDQPTYRRVLTGSELGVKATELAAGSEWPVTVALRIDALAATQRVFGYRLLVFYP